MYNLLTSNVSAIIDIVALIFVVIFALWGTIRGFTKTFFSVFGTLIGLLLALLLCSSVANFMQQKYQTITKVGDSLAGVLTNIFGDTLMNTTLSQATENYLKEQGLGSLIISIVLSAQEDSSIPMNTTLNEIICPSFAYYIVAIISAVILFIIFKLIFYLIGAVVKSMYKNKFVERFDRLLGFALGLIQGVVILEFIIMLISILPIAFFQDIYAGIQISRFAKFIETISLYKVVIRTIAGGNVVNIVKSIVTGV